MKQTVLKNVELDKEVVRVLTIQGLNKGFKNFKTYAQDVLVKQAEKKS